MWAKILVCKYRALGDAILGLSSLQYLKSLYPEIEITYAVQPWIVPLFKDIHCSADRVIPLPLKSIGDWWRSYKELSNYPWDAIIELNQSGRSGKFLRFLAWKKGIPYFYHNHHRKTPSLIIDQGQIKPNIQRDLDGIYSFIKKVDPKCQSRIPSYFDFQPEITLPGHLQSQVAEEKKFKTVVLGLSAGRETKMWPLLYYKELIRVILNELSSSVRFLIPLSTSKADLLLLNKIYAIKFPLNEAVKILQVPLSELPNKLKEGDLYIGNDTGVKHICAGIGMKTITFFGPEGPNEWHPYVMSKHDYFFIESLECRTRSAHFCGIGQCSSMICLNQFSPKEVWNYIRKIKFI